MFEVLYFLFEQYYHAEVYPDSETLERKLVAAGFEEDEINEALDWLGELNERGPWYASERLVDHASVRIYSPEESARLDTNCRGLLAFLESAGALDAAERELAIDRLLAVKSDEIEPGQIKLVVLMVLWSRGKMLDGLLLEELLNDEDARTLH